MTAPTAVSEEVPLELVIDGDGQRGVIARLWQRGAEYRLVDRCRYADSDAAIDGQLQSEAARTFLAGRFPGGYRATVLDSTVQKDKYRPVNFLHLPASLVACTDCGALVVDQPLHSTSCC